MHSKLLEENDKRKFTLCTGLECNVIKQDIDKIVL